MLKSGLVAAVSAALFMSAGAASAATVDITIQGFSDRASAVSAQNSLRSGGTTTAYEDFESFTSFDSVYPGSNNSTQVTLPITFDVAGPNAGSALSTNVGNFTSILPQGTGGSSRVPENSAIIRSNADENNNGQPNFGRYDADDGTNPGSNFIDSNDNKGISLVTLAGLQFDLFSFILTDFDDVGANDFGIEVSSPIISPTSELNSDSRLNGDVFLVTLDFSNLLSNVTIDLGIGLSDGFGADSFAAIDTGLSAPAAVPLPGAGFLLLAGFAGLGVAARRRTNQNQKA